MRPAPPSSNRRRRPRRRWPVRNSRKGARVLTRRAEGCVPWAPAARGGAGNVRPSQPPAPHPEPSGVDVPGPRCAGKAMAPAASKLRAEADVGAFPRRALAQYLRLLRLYPVLTKATTRSARSGGGGDGPGRGAGAWTAR